jgi:hypothetical protein
MKTVLKYIFTCISFLSIFSCSNDFLSENPENSSVTVAETIIFVSPDWEVRDYPVSAAYAGNAKFSITSAPKWLNIVENTGKFKNDSANIRLSAIFNSDFSEVGIYNGVINLELENKGLYQVPVFYINEGNPEIETTSDLTFGYNFGQENLLTIKNNGEGILVWEITEHPKWITVQPVIDFYPSNILPQKMESSIYLSFNPEVPFPENPTGQIVIRSNDKNRPEVVVKIDFDFGYPSLYCYNNNLDFGRTETTQTIDLSNQGNGILVWSIEDCPEWLTATEMNGVMRPYEWKYLFFTCDRNLMQAGRNSAVIKLKTNDKNTPVYEITVSARNGSANAENIIGIEGRISDAWMDKKTDLLYLTTAQPNRFVAYDTKTKTISRTLDLSNIPNCFSISEDGYKLVVGHNGKISQIDIRDFSINQINIDYSVYDIAWGDDDWYCYTYSGTSFSDLRWINFLTGDHYENVEQDLDGASIVKRIPNQNYMVATRFYTSPSGITVYDIHSKEKVNYMHQDLGKFWFANSGNFIVDNSGNVYKTAVLPTYSNWESMPPVYRLNGDFYYNSINWIDDNTISNNLWALFSPFYYEQGEIQQFEMNDFTLVNTYYYDDYYKTSTSAEYPVEGHYVFANGQGTELIVIRNVAADYGINAWSLEHIPVTK